MLDLGQVSSRKLVWKQTRALKRVYELKADGEDVAALRFDTGFGSRATGETAKGKWTFKRVGFLTPRVTVREAGAEADLALFVPNLGGGGVVTFVSGSRFTLKSLNFWGTEWAFLREDRSTALSLRGPRGMVRRGGEMTVSAEAAALSETPILALLAWYVRLLAHADEAAAAGS